MEIFWTPGRETSIIQWIPWRPSAFRGSSRKKNGADRLCTDAKEDLSVKERKKQPPKVFARRAFLFLVDAVIVAFSFYFALLLRADGAVEATWWPHNRALLYHNLPWIVVHREAF